MRHSPSLPLTSPLRTRRRCAGSHDSLMLAADFAHIYVTASPSTCGSVAAAPPPHTCSARCCHGLDVNGASLFPPPSAGARRSASFSLGLKVLAVGVAVDLGAHPVGEVDRACYMGADVLGGLSLADGGSRRSPHCKLSHHACSRRPLLAAAERLSVARQPLPPHPRLPPTRRGHIATSPAAGCSPRSADVERALTACHIARFDEMRCSRCSRGS